MANAKQHIRSVEAPHTYKTNSKLNKESMLKCSCRLYTRRRGYCTSCTY